MYHLIYNYWISLRASYYIRLKMILFFRFQALWLSKFLKQLQQFELFPIFHNKHINNLHLWEEQQKGIHKQCLSLGTSTGKPCTVIKNHIKLLFCLTCYLFLWNVTTCNSWAAIASLFKCKVCLLWKRNNSRLTEIRHWHI